MRIMRFLPILGLAFVIGCEQTDGGSSDSADAAVPPTPTCESTCRHIVGCQADFGTQESCVSWCTDRETTVLEMNCILGAPCTDFPAVVENCAPGGGGGTGPELTTCAAICEGAATNDGVTPEQASCWRTAVSALGAAVGECNLSSEACAECLTTNEITDAQCADALTQCQMPMDIVSDDFGEDCYLPDGCDSDSPDWPDCTDLQCDTGNCQFPVFGLDYGFCSRECTENFQCENAQEGGSYGTQFVCNTDGTAGVCAPGSNRRCDGPQNGMCEAENEVCKFALLFAPDGTYGGACQPATPMARATGESCDEEAGIFCQNDMCLYGVCTSICDPESDNNVCPEGFSCFDDWTPFSNSATITVDMCLPQYCETDTDCSDDFVCTLGFDFNANNVLRGICVPFEEGDARPGEECNDDTPCAAAGCFDGYCGGLCNSDDDCPNDDYCSIVNFRINADPGSAPAQVCQPGTGSGRECAINADCAADPDNGFNEDEACEYVVRGDLEGGIPTGELTVRGRCTTIPTAAVGAGEECGQLAPCINQDLCLSAGTNFCAVPCRNTGDCAEGSLCFGLGITTDIQGGVCVPADRLGLTGSSFSDCRSDGECPDGEFCRLNVIGSSDPVVERFCATNQGEGDLSSVCDSDEDCKSDTCVPRSTDVMEPGYCFGPCGNDADCGEGFGCARQIMHPTGATAKVCRPIDVCGPCALDGTLACGGDLVCSHLVYDGVGPGEACLTPCDGPEDESCAAGTACAPHKGVAGEVTEGEFVCTPSAPVDTCGAALPR